MAASKLRKIAESAAKTVSRAKRKSDEVYNARRRVKRKLERELKKENPNKNLVESLQAKISQSYATKSGEYLIDIERFQQESYSYKRSYEKVDTVDIKRKNELMRHEINQASIGGVSKYTKEETKIFYAATKRAWEGKPQGKWNEAIMTYYGVQTLEEAWNLVFSDENVQKALSRARASQEQVRSEQDIAEGATDEKEEIGSPDYIKELIITMDMS